jgi:hypothetical protein
MLPYVARTATAAVTALAVAAASVVPANALGRDERNFLKGVAAAIIVNEVLKSTRAQAQPVQRYVEPDPVYVPSYPKPTQSQANVTASAFREYSPAARRAIQTRLRAYGYYTGAIDGVWGPRTARALAAYAADSGLSSELRTYGGSVRVMNALVA